MKKTFVLLLSAALLYGCSQSTPANQDAAATATGNSYGTSIAEENEITAAQLQESIAGQDSIQATVTAEVVQS